MNITIRRWLSAVVASAVTGASLMVGGIAAVAQEPEPPIEHAEPVGTGGHAEPIDARELAEPAEPAEPVGETGPVEEAAELESGGSLDSGPAPVGQSVAPGGAEDAAGDPAPAPESPTATKPHTAEAADDKATTSVLQPGQSYIVNRVISGATELRVTAVGGGLKTIQVVRPDGVDVTSTGDSVALDFLLQPDEVGMLLPSGSYRIIFHNQSDEPMQLEYEISVQASGTTITRHPIRPDGGLLVGATARYGTGPMPDGTTAVARVTGPDGFTASRPMSRVPGTEADWRVHFGTVPLGLYVVHVEFAIGDIVTGSTWNVDVIANDETPPSIQLETVPGTSNARGWFARDVEVHLIASDPGSGPALVEWRVDGGEWQSTPSNRTQFALGHGQHTIEYRATDVAGNETQIRTRQLDIDTVEPEIVPVVPVHGGQYELGSSHTVDIGCDDDLSGVFQCSASVANGEPLDTSRVGHRSIFVTAIDRAGNILQIPVDYEIVEPPLPTVDLNMPEPRGLDDWYTEFPVIGLQSASSSDVERIEWRVSVDGAPPVTGGADGNRASYAPRQDGDYEFSYWAIDRLGRTGEPVTIRFKIDTTAPEIEIESPTAGLIILGTEVEADFGCSDATSGLADCTGTVGDGELLPTDALGRHAFEVEATDEAGNTARAAVEYEVVAEPGTRDPADPQTAGDGRGLAQTGVSIGVGIAIAIALLLAGAVVALSRRTAAP